MKWCVRGVEEDGSRWLSFQVAFWLMFLLGPLQRRVLAIRVKTIRHSSTNMNDKASANGVSRLKHVCYSTTGYSKEQESSYMIQSAPRRPDVGYTSVISQVRDSSKVPLFSHVLPT
jgi:hypothetical protein